MAHCTVLRYCFEAAGFPSDSGDGGLSRWPCILLACMPGLQREHEFSNDVNMLLIDAIQRLTRDKAVEHNDDDIPCSVQPSLPPSVLTKISMGIRMIYQRIRCISTRLWTLSALEVKFDIAVATLTCNISKVMRQTLHITELSVHVGRCKQTVAAGRASDLRALLEGSITVCFCT